MAYADSIDIYDLGVPPGALLEWQALRAPNTDTGEPIDITLSRDDRDALVIDRIETGQLTARNPGTWLAGDGVGARHWLRFERITISDERRFDYTWRLIARPQNDAAAGRDAGQTVSTTLGISLSHRSTGNRIGQGDAFDHFRLSTSECTRRIGCPNGAAIFCDDTSLRLGAINRDGQLISRPDINGLEAACAGSDTGLLMPLNSGATFRVAAYFFGDQPPFTYTEARTYSMTVQPRWLLMLPIVGGRTALSR
jgi:hypothetical protein